MTSAVRRPVRFDPAVHDVQTFDSTEAALAIWLQRFAGQNQRRDAARTFVVTDGTPTVIGYYSLVGGQLDHEHAITDVRRGLSRHFRYPSPCSRDWPSITATTVETSALPCSSTHSTRSARQ